MPFHSAWALEALPQQVLQLESEFMANVQMNLDVTPYISDEARGEIGFLINKGHPTRTVADGLTLALASEWLEGQRRRFGEDAVRIVWQGPERLFEPFDSTMVPIVPSAEKKEAFLEGFDHLNILARGIIEFECSPEVRNDKEGRQTLEKFDRLAEAMAPIGIVLGDGRRYRCCSITDIELGLKVFLDGYSARFCLTDGRKSRRRSEYLHKTGFHPAGIRLEAERLKGRGPDPLRTTLQSLTEGVRWSLISQKSSTNLPQP